MSFQKSLNCGQRSGSKFLEEVERIDDAVLHQKKTARGDEWVVEVHFLPDVCFAVLTVQQHHYGARGLSYYAGNLIENLGVYGATNKVSDTRVREIVHLLNIHSNDSSVADEVKDIGKKVR